MFRSERVFFVPREMFTNIFKPSIPAEVNNIKELPCLWSYTLMHGIMTVPRDKMENMNGLRQLLLIRIANLGPAHICAKKNPLLFSFCTSLATF